VNSRRAATAALLDEIDRLEARIVKLKAALTTCHDALGPFAQLADVLTIIDAKNENKECLLTISDPQRSRDIRALAIFEARDARNAAKALGI
jgi:hypothetical protein